MRITVGTPVTSHLKYPMAPITWLARQMSARVTESPWQKRPVSFSFFR